MLARIRRLYYRMRLAVLLYPRAENRNAARVMIRESSDQLFFVYAGGALGLMINPAVFFSKTRLMERNVVMFRDPRLLHYQMGISETIRSFEDLARWHIDFCSHVKHVRRVFCLGTSMGGYAALLFGHMLGAEEVWAFGPQTHLRGIRRLAGLRIPPERLDLSVLLGHGNGTTKYNIYYNKSNQRDEAHAQRVAHCAGVRTWPLSGRGHGVVGTLLELNQLEQLLPTPSELKPVR